MCGIKQNLSDCSKEDADFYGLCDVRLHSRVRGGLLIFLESIGCHGDDGAAGTGSGRKMVPGMTNVPQPVIQPRDRDYTSVEDRY